MTSAINSTAIDAAFPVAGQDNNSQGFRDNFDYIKTGLATAASEITALQANTEGLELTGVTVGGVDGSDFNDRLINNAVTNRLLGTVYTIGTTASYTIDTREAEYFVYQLNTNAVTLTFSQWPASDRFAKVRVDVRSDGSARTVTFATTSGTVIVNGATFPLSLSTNTAHRHVFDAWTVNGGNTVYVKYVGVFA